MAIEDFVKNAKAVELTYPQTGLPGESKSGDLIVDIVSNFMKGMLSTFAMLGIVGFVIAAIIYFTAAGDEKRAEAGKRGMMYAIIGVVVGASGLVILHAVNKLLEGSSVTF